jgi:hypothetical protein
MGTVGSGGGIGDDDDGGDDVVVVGGGGVVVVVGGGGVGVGVGECEGLRGEVGCSSFGEGGGGDFLEKFKIGILIVLGDIFDGWVCVAVVFVVSC